MKFFTGIFNVADVKHFGQAFVSVHRLATRKSGFAVGEWIMDSGAFSTIAKHGGFPEPVSAYAAQIRRWKDNGTLLAAVAQDYMCEPIQLAKTGLTVAEHQRLTIERYDALVAENTGVYIMPVLQGYASAEYVSHLRQYGDRLKPGMWVGVGSICKRNANPMAIWKVLDTIKDARPDLRLHGFGLKVTALKSPFIRELLHTADSMAWSFAARRERRDHCSWQTAKEFETRVNEICAVPACDAIADLFLGVA
ncbi:hypothetical protein UFOVP1670_48 [uncultured Caudovirales phage]|uniref:DeoxyPurine in DNA protein A domain-containing protein n=1 Tax=uncultured Caudovirales phage TaxID=2100421 RepID=A0A6J5T736_9CAUD|nr:hypothetical protein UFOVP1670_48 [uncultured Caudovirales phage]